MIQILHYLLETCVTFPAAIIIKAVVKTVWTNKSLIDIMAAPEVSLINEKPLSWQKDEVCHEFFQFVKNFLCENIHIHYGP